MMPAALGAVIFSAFGASAVGATVIAGTTLASIVGGVILTAASLALSILLAPKPKLPKASQSYLPLRQSIPPRITGYGEARPPFCYMFYETLNTDSYDVYAFHHGRVAEITRHYMNDDVVSLDEDGGIVTSSQNNKYFDTVNGAYKPFVTIETRSGAATETPYEFLIENCALVASSTGKDPMWTASHRGDGIASLFIFQKSPSQKNAMDRYPRGLYTPSVAARLSYVYDPRSLEQNRNDATTWQWSDNPIIAIADYLSSEDHGMGLPWSELFGSGAGLIDEANICDEPVLLKAGGTEKRYRLGGCFQHDNPPADVLAAMLATCDGWFAENGDGTIKLLSGKYRAPTVTFKDEHVLSYTVQRGIADEQVINEFIPTYTSRDHEFAEVEGQPWRDEQDISERGRARSEKLDIAWVQSHGQARRLCKRQMLRQGARLSGSLKTRLYGLVGLGERFIKLEIANCPDLADLVIEIVAPPRVDLVGRFVQFEWKSVNPNVVDAWDPDTEEGDAPPIPVRNEANVPQIPTDIEVVVEGDADRSITAIVSFDDLGDAKGVYLLSLRVVKPDGSPTRWVESQIGDEEYTIAGGRVSFDIIGLAPDTDYELQIEAKNGSGRLSGPSTIVEFDTKQLAPRAPTGFFWDEASGRLRWDAPLSESFYCARVFRATLGASFSTATDISGAILGDPGESQSFVPPAASSASYWVVAETSDGLRSSPLGPLDLQDTSPQTPIKPKAVLDGSTVNLSVKSALNDINCATLESRRRAWSTANPLDGTVIGSPQLTAPNEPKYWTDTPGYGMWIYDFFALNKAGSRSAAATATPTIEILRGVYDFAADTYTGPALTVSGGANGWVENAAGLWASGRRSDKGRLVEAESTNLAANSTWPGAVLGVLGSGGSLPNNWALTSLAGITREVVFIGTINGLEVIGIRFSGTPSATTALQMIPPTVTQAVGTTIANSLFVSLAAGSLANIAAGAIGISAGPETVRTTFTPTSVLTRYTNVRTLTQTQARLTFRWNYTNTTTPVDHTFYFAAPQTEVASSVSSVIKTNSTTPVTRTADSVSLTLPSGSTTMLYTFDDNSQQTVSVSPGAYVIPTTLNRRQIRKMVFW